MKLNIFGIFTTLPLLLFGDMNPLLMTLIIFIILDYIIGISASILVKDKSFKVDIAIKGLVRKGCLMSLIIIAHRIDIVMDSTFVRTGVIYLLCANEMSSLFSHLVDLGIPIPKVLLDIKNNWKGDKHNDENTN